MDDTHDNGELPKRPGGPHQGLPVLGYRDQDGETVDLVNMNEDAEERVLRILDDLADRPDIDKCWLAIGRTAIEQGFMAVNRSIFRPARVDLADEDAPVEESGWLIEAADSPTDAPSYLQSASRRVSPEEWWASDHMRALRFAREEDATSFARSYLPDTRVRICEHRWS